MDDLDDDFDFDDWWNFDGLNTLHVRDEQREYAI